MIAVWIGVAVAFLAAFLAMAVGPLLGRKPISGNCKGSLEQCDICGGDANRCEQTPK
ncbi:MAG: hypothetical protein ISN29_03320 [Gammaproteobacteria bacterium AqS3]|nr:hypothetical protein [Gammaproteobacteria bacterium AqS3]